MKLIFRKYRPEVNKLFFAPRRAVSKDTRFDFALNPDELDTMNTGLLADEHVAPTPESGPAGLSGDQLLDYRILGTRKNLQRWNGGILDKAYSEAMERHVNQIIEVERMQGIQHRYTVPGGVFSRARHWIRRKIGGETRTRIEEHYGEGRTMDSKQGNAAINVLNPLSGAQRTVVEDFLTDNGIPLPAMPAPVPDWLRGNPPLMIRQILQVTTAPENLLERMRATVRDAAGFFFPPAPNDPLRPASEHVPGHPIEYLIASKKIEGERKEQQNSTAINDTRRLGAFLKDLEDHHKEIYDLIVKTILKEHSTYSINDPNAKSTLRYLEKRLALKSDEAVLQEDLEYIRDNVPKLKEAKKPEKKEGEKSEAEEKAEMEKLTEQTDKFTDSYDKLADYYTKAESLGNELFDANKQLDAAIAASAEDTSGLSDAVKEKGKDKGKMLDETLRCESQLLKEAAALHKMLKDKDETAVSASTAEIKDLVDMFITTPRKKSESDDIFGVTKPATPTTAYTKPPHNIALSFTNLIYKEFDTTKVQALKKEITDKFHGKFKKTTKLNWFELQVALRERDAKRKGTYPDEDCRIEATAATMIDVSRVTLVSVDRSANREHQEWLGSGRLTRAKKWLKAKLNMDGMYTARNLIDHVSGFEKDFGMFRKMRPDITEEELINLIDTKGGISDQKLFEFMTKLSEVFNGFEKLQSNGKVQLFDGDAYNLQQLIHTLSKVRSVLWTRTGYEGIRDKEGNPHENMITMLRERRKMQSEEHKSVLEKVKSKAAEWKTYFSKGLLKKKFFDVLAGKRTAMKESKMSAKEFEESLQNDGLTTAYDTLKTALVAKEAYDITKTVAGVTGGALKKGGKVFAAGTGGILSTAYGRGIRPVAKGLLIDAPKWTAGKIGKGLKWSVGKGKHIAFPLVLAGGILGAAWAWSKEPWSSGKSHTSGGHH